MKKLTTMLISFLTMACLISCEKEIKTYSGETNIYFLPSIAVPAGAVINDSTLFSFAYAKPNVKDSILKLVIRIEGAPTNVDRPYQLSTNPSSTAVENTHFTFVNKQFVIKANKITDTLKIKFNRTPDMAANRLKLMLDLLPSENFKTKMESKVINSTTGKKLWYTKHTVWADDVLNVPKFWSIPSLGTFTRKKVLLMGDVLGIDISTLNTNVTIPEVMYYGSFMQRYLNEMKANNKTIYEDDGSPMIMGLSSQ